jgi:hypothetical protein
MFFFFTVKLPAKDITYLQRYFGGTRYRSWLRHYATSRKVAGSSPDEVDFFNLPTLSSPVVDSASNRNEYQESSWGVKGGRRLGLTTAICEPIV